MIEITLKKGPAPFWGTRTENDFLVAAYSIVATEITNYSGRCCCFTAWPWRLPDPKVLAMNVHKRIQEQLFEVHFRDMPGMCERLKINYDTAIAGRMFAAASASPPAELPAVAEKPAAPSPAPATADPEAGAA